MSYRPISIISIFIKVMENFIILLMVFAVWISTIQVHSDSTIGCFYGTHLLNVRTKLTLLHSIFPRHLIKYGIQFFWRNSLPTETSQQLCSWIENYASNRFISVGTILIVLLLTSVLPKVLHLRFHYFFSIEISFLRHFHIHLQLRWRLYIWGLSPETTQNTNKWIRRLDLV